jgi:hypothetical protein
MTNKGNWSLMEASFVQQETERMRRLVKKQIEPMIASRRCRLVKATIPCAHRGPARSFVRRRFKRPLAFKGS